MLVISHSTGSPREDYFDPRRGTERRKAGTPANKSRVPATRARPGQFGLNDAGWYGRSGRHYNAAVSAPAFRTGHAHVSRRRLLRVHTGAGGGMASETGLSSPSTAGPTTHVHPLQVVGALSCSTMIRDVSGSPRIRKCPALGSWMFVAPRRTLPSGMCGSNTP